MNAFWEIVASNAVLVVILAAVITVVGRFWKNPQGLHLLWLLVLLKFVTPPLLTVPIYLPSQPIAVEAKHTVAPSPDMEAAFAVDEKAADSEPRLARPSFDQEPIAGADKPADAPSHTPIPWLGILAGLWGIGIVGTGFWQAFRIRRFHRLLHSAHPATGDVLSMVAEVGKQLGLRRIPRVRMLPVRVSPMVLSAGFRPQLLLPMELFKRLETTAQSSLLAHELAHIRRKDHLVRLLELMVTTLFWWHPLVWWACWELQKLEDLCCDAIVVSIMPGNRKVYATALMNTLDFLCDGSIAAPLGITATQSSVLLTRRIAMLKNHSGVMRLTLGRIVMLLLLAVVPMSIAFAAKPPKGDESNSAKAEGKAEGASQPTVVVPNLDNTADSAPVTPTVNNQFGKTSNAKPVDEVSHTSDKPPVAATRTKKPGRYFMTPASAVRPDIPGMEVRNNATFLMLVDVSAVTKHGKVDGDSETWHAIHDDLQKMVRQSGRFQKLHVRFFFARGVDFHVQPKLDEHFKRLVADLNLYVVCLDSHLRNDEVTWDEYYRELMAKSVPATPAPAPPKANDQLNKTSAAKPAGEVSLASDQPATKEGAKTESKPAPAHPLVAAPNTAEARAIADIEKLGGTVWASKYKGKPTIVVNLTKTNLTDAGLVNLNDLPRLVLLHLRLENTQVTDAGLVHLKGLTQLEMLSLFKDNITGSGLEHLKGLTQFHHLLLGYTKVADAGLAKLKGLTQLESLDLSGTRITDAGLDHLKGLTHLQTLFLAETPITDAGLANLNGLTKLQSLDLEETQVANAGLAYLKGLTLLQELRLSNTKVTDAGLANLKGLIKLQSLGLAGTQVTDAGLANLKGLPLLQELRLSNTKVTDAGLANLNGLTKLQSLDLEETQVANAGLANLKGLPLLQELRLSNTKVTDAGLANLKGLIKLQSLGLAGTQVTDAGLANLKGLTNLRTLALGGTRVTDAGLEHLKGLKQLQKLFLSGLHVTDAGLANLNGLPNLSVLWLEGTQVTDAGLANLKECTKLALLDVAGTQVTDTGLVHLKGLAGLSSLVLAQTKVTDAGLVQLEGSTKLLSLHLNRTPVTDAGLEHLKGLTELRFLYLGGTKVTDEGVRKLQQMLPKCEIDRIDRPAVRDATSTTSSQGKTVESEPASPDSAVPKASDQSDTLSPAKPADEVSPASDQSATKEVAKAKYDAARAKVEDDINVRYATAAADVAKAEYELKKEANRAVPGSIPKVRINELLLKCKEADLAIEKARHEQQIAAKAATVAKAELEAAKRKVADLR